MNKDQKPSQGGSTLIELIISVVILGLVLMILLALFFSLSKNLVTAQGRSTATYLARDLTEQILSRRFDEKAAPTDDGSGNLVWSSIGVDSGESGSTMSTFDDVDDFNGWTDTPLSGFSRTVTVTYADKQGSAIQSVTTSDAIQKGYKMIHVQVARQGTTLADLVTVKSARR